MDEEQVEVRTVRPEGAVWMICDAAGAPTAETFKDRDEAVARAREQLEALGGGDLVLVEDRGQLREKIAAAPGVTVRTSRGERADGAGWSPMEADDEQ